VSNFLRRYTDVLSVIDMVCEGRLTLLPPNNWPDRNDALGLDLYRKLSGSAAIYASCMTEAKETAHHWQVFSNHSHGVCVVFKKDELLSAFDSQGIIHGPMQYRNLSYLNESRGMNIEALPFLKRDTFEAEAEYRALSTESVGLLAASHVYVRVPVESISKIVIGPTVPRSLGLMLKRVIREQRECESLRVTFSTLWNNQSWHKALASAFPQAT
jgi:hypothetical protein